jgi:hypothetical protein
MNTLVDTAKSAVFKDGQIVVLFSSGLEIRFPVTQSPRLAAASSSALSDIRVSPFGLHWPQLDEDLSFAGILRGQFGQRPQSGLTRR